MQLRLNRLFGCAVAALLAGTAAAAPTYGGSKPNFIVFGNSLTDVGNAAALTNTPAYWQGRFTNSFVWNEYAAKLLGMTLVNRAYGGATSNNGLTPGAIANVTIPSFRDQVSAWLAANPAPPLFNQINDVIEIEIGGNDLLNRLPALLAAAVDVPAFVAQLAASVAADAQRLRAAGYRNVRLWNLPSVDLGPLVVSVGAAPLIKPIVASINAAVAAAVAPLGVRVLDLNALNGVAMQPPVLAAMDIVDTTSACLDVGPAGVAECANADQHFFYDGIHPASRMHYLWGVVSAMLERYPSTPINAATVKNLVLAFNIGSSSRDDNIIVGCSQPAPALI
ncbi:hypothetical protein GGI04_000405 [Coemansia thaxteri]|uniref:Uncharacterized protein n=1 Tax=Coemansia thaxteri TaxID=2663907 RepID=A0A9W8EI10_9FUNG|nr:hypothetical protein H4R26_004602 [Coemansia thaxteri]KAJ2009495.1 hypothetical protein GGI04_000405 [Coemansia thaxteri]KAJ2473861.1 hypothetical protein GGI02_000539 [Coemansia sp. RSA 2322]KAJ2479622.1 hypothetical protein EV174_003965 [Coemansia sp. RSA 2320]